MSDYSDRVSESWVDHRFGKGTAVTPSEDAAGRILSIREGGRILARQLIAQVPPSFERDQALAHLDDAVSCAARGIVRNE